MKGNNLSRLELKAVQWRERAPAEILDYNSLHCAQKFVSILIAPDLSCLLIWNIESSVMFVIIVNIIKVCEDEKCQVEKGLSFRSITR